jgi:hypothetical protein
MNGVSSNVVAQNWGLADDTPSPTDFDGDGKTDFCVYRSTQHTWYMLRSSDGVFNGIDYGLNTDKPVPADYDGDGKADVAVLRESTSSSWYVLQSTNNQTASYTFGTNYTAHGKVMKLYRP